ncbi:MAG: YhfC family intramembrane metalloprotease [Bacteroidales bacterium]|nr:YhfC family intramembrane metalloprotease [Bacteroidales bacterium]
MMAINALIGIVAPFLLARWAIRNLKAGLKSVLTGAGVFVLFALILESIVHQIVLKGPHGAAIIGNTYYYALYGGLMAGLFEEAGRFLSMKFILKKESPAAKTGIAYGVGHGGIELLIIFGVTMVSNLAISALINSGNLDVLLATVPEANRAQVQAQLEGLQTLTVGTLLFGLWERVSAIILQIGLSIIVWTAVRKGGKWLWLFPAAILLHALVDALAVIISKSVGMLATEIVVFALAIAVGSIGWMLAKRLNVAAAPGAAPAAAAPVAAPAAAASGAEATAAPSPASGATPSE